MIDLCILFLHHSDDDLTRHHALLIAEQNPEATFVPLTFNKGLPNAIRPMRFTRGSNEWRDVDILVYNWFQSCERVLARRYIIIEYDTLCSTSLHDFYKDVWDEEIAGAAILTGEKNPGWWWFREIRNPKAYQNKLLGIVPLSGILVSHSALCLMSDLARDPLYWLLYCECRIGTLARTAGYKPKEIRSDATNYLSWQPRIPSAPGLWHSVKKKFD